MNPKIEKLTEEIEKTEKRISSLQARLRSMERQKTELENTEIVATVRGLNLTPEALAAMAKGRSTPPLPTGRSEGSDDED